MSDKEAKKEAKKSTDEEAKEPTNPDEEAERLAAEAAAVDKENKIESLKQEIASLEAYLKEAKIYETIQKYKDIELKNDKELDEAEKKELKELEEHITGYITTYDLYSKKNSELNSVIDDDGKGLFATYILAPISNAFDDLIKKAKNVTVKLATGSAKLGADLFAESMRQMQPSLERIQEIKAEIAASGKIAQTRAESAAATATNVGQGLTNVTESAPTDAIQVLPTNVINSTQGLESAPTSVIQVLPIDRTLDVKKTNAAQNARQIFEVKDDFFQNQNTLAAAAAGGGRHPNIKEVQKGGAAAAKRAQDSIKQFLSSSVTSSQILNMVKRKTKAKRKRNGKRYSRKRAKR